MAISITQYFIKTPAKLHGDHKTQEALIFRYVGYSSERSAFEWEKNLSNTAAGEYGKGVAGGPAHCLNWHSSCSELLVKQFVSADQLQSLPCK